MKQEPETKRPWYSFRWGIVFWVALVLAFIILWDSLVVIIHGLDSR